MTRLQQILITVCERLEIEVVVPFSIPVTSEKTIIAQALLPQLGAPLGMILVNRSSELLGLSSALIELGYGYSCLSEPKSLEEVRIEDYIEMFSDWGWSSTTDPKPSWMIEG